MALILEQHYVSKIRTKNSICEGSILSTLRVKVNGIYRYLKKKIVYLTVKLSAGIVLGINANFEKYIIKIYTPKT